MKTNYIYIIKEDKIQNGNLIITTDRAIFSSQKKALNYLQMIQKATGGEIINNKHGIKLYTLLIYKDDPFTYHLHITKRIIE